MSASRTRAMAEFDVSKGHSGIHSKETIMKATFKTIAILAMALAVTFSAGATGSLYGSSAAKADQSLTAAEMLAYAAQDEYLAHGEYAAIMSVYGQGRPFSNISKAEETHLSWLRSVYEARGMAFPADGSADFVSAPASLKAAFEAGVKAEVDNIAMYDRFLADPLLRDPRNADLRTLFTQLRNASENHLRAFQNQLTRY